MTPICGIDLQRSPYKLLKRQLTLRNPSLVAEDNTIPTKPPISKQQSLTQKNQESINQSALSETMLPLK